MDINRGVLDNLMGRDRNLPKNSKHIRDHYSNSDVCKPFLVCFCFNTLFPNTIYDQGPCNKRHDTYLKTMFDNDLNRTQYEKVYIKECIAWIQRRIQEAEQKTKKNQNTIDGKSSLSTQRPRQILDRILAIDKDIEDMMHQSAVYGENGQIDDSSRCLEEVERLRERRKEIDLMGDNLLAVVKQQKICEICGAIQTINDTQKRIQMHLEGKIHQGFLRLRTEIETLKIRLQILQSKLDKLKQKNAPPAITYEPEVKREPIQAEKPKQEKKVEEKGQVKERQNDKEIEKDKDGGDSNSKKKKKQHKHKEDRDRKDSKDRKKKDKDRSDDRKSQDRDRYDRYDRSHSKQRRKDKGQHKKEKKRRDRSRSPQGDKDRRDRSRSYEKDYRRNYP